MGEPDPGVILRDMPWDLFESWTYFFRVNRWNEKPDELDSDTAQRYFLAYQRALEKRTAGNGEENHIDDVDRHHGQR